MGRLLDIEPDFVPVANGLDRLPRPQGRKPAEADPRIPTTNGLEAEFGRHWGETPQAKGEKIRLGPVGG